MISAVVYGAIYGIATAAYLTFLWSAVRAKSVQAGLIAVTLVFMQVVLIMFEVPCAPSPTRIADALGISVNGDTRIPMFGTLFLVAGGGFAVAHFCGLVRGISHWIDAFGGGAFANRRAQAQD